MLSCTVPFGIRKVADRFKSLFSGSDMSYSALCAMFALYFFAKSSLCDVVRCCPWTPSVSSLSRAVADFEGNRFMRRLRQSILRRHRASLNPQDFAYAIDDTDNPKYGNLGHAVGRWRGSKGGYLGQKILVVALVDIKRNIALPIHYAFALKKSDPHYVSLIDRSVELVGECIGAGFPALPVVTDSWFDSALLMLGLEKIGLTFAGEIKSRRRVRAAAAPRAARHSLKDFFQDELKVSVLASPNQELACKRGKAGRKPRKIMAERVGMINGYPHPLKIIAIFNSRTDPTVYAYYASTDRQMTGAKLWALSRARWTIETMFRDLKQNLSFGRLPCTGKGAADLAVCLPFALYVSLRDEGDEIWGICTKKNGSLGARLSELREKTFDSALNLIACNPQHIVVQSMRARRLAGRLKQKPRCKPAASASDQQNQAGRG